MADDFEFHEPEETREWMAEAVRAQLLRSADIPNLAEAEEALTDYWLEDEEVLAFFPTEYVVTTYGALLTEIAYSVLLAPDPAEALQDKLSHSIYNFARYLVFVIPPAPQEDDLRNPRVGITGELGAHLLEAVRALDHEGEWVFDTKVASVEDADTELTAIYLYWLAKVATLEALAPVYGLDEIAEGWKPLVLRVACSVWEDRYREALGLPPALDEELLAALRLRNFGLKEITGAGFEGLGRAWLDTLIDRFSDDGEASITDDDGEAQARPDVPWAQIENRLATTDLEYSGKADLPGLDATKQLLREYWAADKAVRRTYSVDYLHRYYRLLLQDIVENVLESASPEETLRTKLVDALYTLSRYTAVMVAAEYPGEMFFLLREADEVAPWTALNYDWPLDSAFEELSPDEPLFEARTDDPEDWVYAEFLFWSALVKVLTGLSRALEFEPAPEDWTQSCLAAAATIWTGVYQEMSDGPSDEVRDRDIYYREFFLLLNLARSGARDPLTALQAAMADGPIGPTH